MILFHLLLFLKWEIKNRMKKDVSQGYVLNPIEDILLYYEIFVNFVERVYICVLYFRG